MKEINRNDLKSLMDSMANIEITSKTKSKYEYQGKRVPRVTEILSAMLHEDHLMSWANGLGWKRISYRAFMTDVASKGTFSHLAIEKFLKDGHVELDKLNIHSDAILNVVRSTFSAFMKWWETMKSNHKTVDVVFTEETLIHKYFAGTCDCLLKVDGEYWLVDFKTSNHMSYNYALQLAAYRFLLKELKGIKVSRCMVLMLNKESYDYSTYELDMMDKDHLSFINNCEETFFLLDMAFIARMTTTEEFHSIFGV